MMDKRVLTLIKKELKRVFTDRRLIFSTFILPALSIYIIYSLMGSSIGKMENEQSKYTFDILAVNAPVEIIQMIENPRVEIFDEITEYGKTQLVRDGKYDVLVEFEQDFENKMNDYQNGEVPNVNIFYNPTESKSSAAYNYLVYELLPMYENGKLGQRLGDPKFANVFDINRENTNSSVVEEKFLVGKSMSTLFPMLIAILLFAGAMGLGLDSIAGEKERGTMSSLLMTPVSRNTIAFGKLISLGILAIFSTMSNFAGILLSLPNSSKMFGQGDGFSLSSLGFTATDYLVLIGAMIILVAIYVCMIVSVSVIAKSVKEAGTYISPLYMLIMISSFMTVFTNTVPTIDKYLIPVYGNILVIKDIFTFTLTPTKLLMNIGASVVAIAILVYVIQRLFGDENVMNV